MREGSHHLPDAKPVLSDLYKQRQTKVVLDLHVKATQEFSENEYLVTHFVDDGDTGARLDSFLKGKYRRRSREQIKRAIDDGVILIKREQGLHLTLGKLKPSTQVLRGDEVLVKSERKIEPEVSFDYKVLFEDDALFIIEKPANLPVHPAGRYFFNTLLTHLRTQALGDFYLPHRLDKETSGVMALTKTKEACAALVRQFAERTTRKKYLAIVRGAPQERFTVDLAMRRATHAVVELKMATAPESDGGQSALTEFSTLARFGEFALVECLPKTGRQHQIRVHLEAAGHPIVGDKLYGMADEEAARFYERKFISAEAMAKLLLPRHALHAYELTFEHPSTGKRVTFRSELPEDLLEFQFAQARAAIGPESYGRAKLT